LDERQPGDAAPYFDFHVFVCVNRRPDGHSKGSCAERGSESLRNYMKARAKELGIANVRINGAACLDRCEHGPVMVVYPSGTWYRVQNEADVDEVLFKHLAEHGRARGLVLPNDRT
jgi:(2Fe-2S) ferredoxin